MIDAPAAASSRSESFLPAEACDSHTHVFGPQDNFPLQHSPGFPLPPASIELHRETRRRAGLERGVLVQPAYYGFDHAALIKAMSGDRQTRGIALADADVSDKTLDYLHQAGVRGLRFTEFRNADGSVRAGSVGADQLMRLAPRLRERGWQAHLWAGAQTIDALMPDLLALKLPVVLDHMGMPEISASVADRKFQRLLGAVRDGALWVKLSLCRLADGPDYADVRPFHDALVEANQHRLLWGSDWPFVRLVERPPELGTLLHRFLEWVDDAALRRAILSENPGSLFGFDLHTKGQ